ncbi:MAG: hypothetical protein KF856_15605 [Cyclobacteriaceae bacterium]|nr:hypothetical protein [Cyclobacteriaceae bacterium]
MKIFTRLVLVILTLGFGCGSDGAPDHPCISGKIVGQKCGIYALQLNEAKLNATQWSKKNLITGEIEGVYSNVIGLINLPEENRVEGQIVFVELREPTNEEKTISCYADMPSIPSPLYIVLFASNSKCKETKE